MKLTRKQKRWLRQHRGIVNTVKFLVVLLVIGLIYAGVTAINSDLKISHLLSKDKETTTQSGQGESQTADKPSKGKNEPTQPQYVSQLIELNDTVTLTEAQQMAMSYVPDPSVKKPYMIRVNRAANCVTVYGYDVASKTYAIPIKAMACSTGKNVGDTPTGSGSITDKYTFHLMVDGTYGQYAVRFMSGGILFHSVPYYKNDKSQLESDQFNLLGQVASLGCVRLCVRDAKWIYDNCPQGTDVVVYDDAANPGPLGKPEMIKIPLNSQFAGWDPTDPDPINPWSQYAPMIMGATDVTLNVGDMYNPRNNVTAIDTCGNDITSRIMLSGSYDLGIPGVYTVNYYVEDLIGKTATATVNITVIDSMLR